ncbi:MAG: PD-(D/E)XK nuclease family protein [Candidatus Thorarchaeota archaeon]
MSEDEIVSREFKHGRTSYAFRWNTSHHRALGKDNGDLAALWSHLELVARGKIPEEPFSSPFYVRASSLRLRKMSSHARIGLRSRFLRNGIVEESIEDDLVKRVREYHRLRNDRSYSSDHSILREFLLHDPATIAIEVPVWSETYQMSGHIDLVRFVDGTVQVCDYKPGRLERTKNRFLESLPQVAAYGEMMAHHLASTLRSALNAPLLPRVRCSIFDTHSSWHFGAEMFVQLRAAELIE